ncbi:Uu.00g106670.m01.CDS01 [Anthostomella pinea]|uniref:Uu.00g106670.m01.CDS01 n=1 Tax=Anthostomella pinea TaxID=933095 RepID=A0AAI8VE84_9PEZI|nr:Uu.00g106670.m01.CDS01 [Anthostomella pinea]
MGVMNHSPPVWRSILLVGIFFSLLHWAYYVGGPFSDSFSSRVLKPAAFEANRSSDIAHKAPEASSVRESTNTSDVFNSTLGFEKVIGLNLPDRADKRDNLSLMSALTGFKISWVDGVLGPAVPDKAVPFGWDRTQWPEANLGSWRGHINAIRSIVEDDLSSALILEDDVDWDVSLKPQLSQFAEAAKTLQADFPKSTLHPDPSPYGQDWDLLWIGACLTRFNREQSEPKVLLRNDPTVAPRHRLGQNDTFAWDEYPEHSRIVYVPDHDTICSFAYALSREGARKALLYLGVEDQPTVFDFHMSDLCRDKPLGIRCISLVPGLFMHHRPRGRVSHDSDILEFDPEEVREVGTTENILYSTRLNLRNLIEGREPQKQWAD